MSDKWLVKFASQQPTAEAQLRQQIDALPVEDLRDLVGPSSTETIDSFQEKSAAAINQGRQMAHEVGPQLVEKAAQDTEQVRALANALSFMSDESVIKMAHVLEHGSDVEKVAVVGNLLNMVGKGLKTVGGFAAKRPGTAAAIGGAGLGALMGGEGNRLGGALGGAAIGAGAAKLSPKLTQGIQRGAFGMGLHGQNLINKGMAKMAEEVQSLYKVAFVGGMAAKCSPFGEDTSWLTQFEGSPLLEQAIGLAEAELQIEIQEIQKAQERQRASMDDDSWTQRDIIRARKKLLELQLVSQRNGLGQQGQQEQAPAPQQSQEQQPQPQQGQQQPQGVGGPGGVQMPMGQQKQANAFDVIRGIGSGAARTVAKPVAHAADALDPMSRGALPGFTHRSAGQAVGSAAALGGIGALGYAAGKNRGYRKGVDTGFNAGEQFARDDAEMTQKKVASLPFAARR